MDRFETLNIKEEHEPEPREEKEESLCIPKPKRRQGLPWTLITRMKDAGASVEKVKGEKLTYIYNISYGIDGSDSFRVYEEWASEIEVDPMIGKLLLERNVSTTNASLFDVGTLFFPQPHIANSVICPPDQLGIAIQNEARSIAYFYAPLFAIDFANGNIPPIPAPQIAGVPALIQFAHPKLALSALLQRIQNPPITYPTLSSLRSGSYIVNVQQTWSNAVVDIALFKP